MNNNNHNNIPTIKLKSIVLDCPDIEALSDFYIRMLGWEKDFVEEGDFLDIRSPHGGAKIAFQTNTDYVPPVWPEEPNAQQQMLHIDFSVQSKEELERAVKHAISCGATKAATQFCDEWTVMLDPVGHPFCFVVG